VVPGETRAELKGGNGLPDAKVAKENSQSSQKEPFDGCPFASFAEPLRLSRPEVRLLPSSSRATDAGCALR
jgi:hypothetical protein